jgi:L-threonylcarbamoyladenylate synthase
VRQGLGRRIKYILDGGPSQIGLESTIVDLRQPEKPVLLRPGAITQAQLEKALGRRVGFRQRAETEAAPERGGQLAPGLLARHYSPRTPVVLHPSLSEANRHAPREAFVFLAKPAHATRPNIFWFDRRGDLAGVARRLFATLRRLDAMNFKTIHVELAPGAGLADAINDRLRRAAAR